MSRHGSGLSSAAVLLAGLALAGCASTTATTATTATATGSRVQNAGGECRGPHQTEILAWHLQKVDRLPEIVQRVPPAYPEIAIEAGVHGIVTIQALICADGSVQEARVVRSIAMLDDAAIDAVRQWTFEPASAGGEAVAAWVEAPIEFRLPERPESRDVR